MALPGAPQGGGGKSRDPCCSREGCPLLRHPRPRVVSAVPQTAVGLWGASLSPPTGAVSVMFPISPEPPRGSDPLPSIFSVRFGPRTGGAQRRGVSRGLAHAGVGRAVWEAQGLPPGDAHAGSFTSSWGQEPRGAGRGAGAGGEEEVRVGSRGRQVCRPPSGAGRTAAVCTAPGSATALSGSAFQLPAFLTARLSPQQTPAAGLRTLLPGPHGLGAEHPFRPLHSLLGTAWRD